VQDVKRVTREHAFPKANDIPVVVVLGGFDQDNAELPKPWRRLGDQLMFTWQWAQHIFVPS
jgi:hypothetical protein